MLFDFRFQCPAATGDPDRLNQLRASLMVAVLCVCAAVITAPCVGQEAPATAEADAPAADLPTGKQVVEDFIGAIGGREAYGNMKSLVMKGELNIPMASMSVPLFVQKAAPNKFVFEIDMGDIGQLVRGTNGDVAWEVSPITGARLLEGTEKDEFIREADFTAQINPENYYKSIECVGQEEIDGTPAYVVELVDAKSGNKETHLYDTQTHLLLKTKAVRSTQMGNIDAETTLRDYRNVNGVKHAFEVVVDLPVLGQQQIFKFKEIESNVEVADKAFEPPKEIVELLKKE